MASVLSPISVIQSQPKYPSKDDWIQERWYTHTHTHTHTHNEILFSLKKAGNPVIGDNVGKPGGHDAK